MNTKPIEVREAGRKIIQIAVSGEEQPTIVALCADGTAWKWMNKSIGPGQWRQQWDRLIPIPSDLT